jgi:dynein heavy chain
MSLSLLSLSLFSLCSGIVSDIFMGTPTEFAPENTFTRALEESAKALSSVPLPDFINKCQQLYNTLLVRHGVMLVGEAMSGKTKCIQKRSNRSRKGRRKSDP